MNEDYGPEIAIPMWRLPNGTVISLSVFPDGLGPRIEPEQFGWMLIQAGATPIEPENATERATLMHLRREENGL